MTSIIVVAEGGINRGCEMSYNIIKSIKVKENKVYISSACNNVRPRYYDECECKSLSRVLQEKGQEALDVEILKAYEEGDFQRGRSKYTRALQVLRHFDAYKKFDWRASSYKKDCPIQANRESEKFTDLLKLAMKTQLPKDKFVISKLYGAGVVYLWKRTKLYAKWLPDKSRAKVFRYKEDAEFLKKCYTNGDAFIVERV